MILEKLHKTFSNGRVYLMETEDGYPLEVTDTYLPYYTKNCINEHTNELKSGELGDRRERWMIGVSCMSGCPIGCLFCFDEDTDILMSDGTMTLPYAKP